MIYSQAGSDTEAATAGPAASICLSVYVRQHKTGTRHFSQRPDISPRNDILSPNRYLNPMSGVRTISHYLLTLASFLFLYHYLTQRTPTPFMLLS